MNNRTHYALITATLLAAITAGSAAAQRETIVARMQQPRAWLGFSYENTTYRVNGTRQPAIVVLEIVEDSPAESAGLAVGDTVLTINDLRVSSEFMSSLSTSLAPGDRVRLHIRRGGRDRDISVQAAERPAGYGILTPGNQTFSFEVSPDSLRGRVRLFLDSALVALDTMRFPDFRVESRPGGGVWMFTDSARFEVVPDSLWNHRGALVFPHDSAFFRRDSAWVRGMPRVSAFSFRGDSLITLRTDSALLRAMPRGFSFEIDSMPNFRVRVPQLEGGRIFGLRGDSLFTYEALPGGFGIATFGMRAIGGAELTDLDPDLGEYFGTDEGVLVVRVPDRTPADRAGLEAGDVIVRVNDRDVASIAELRRALPRSGQPIRLEIIRRNARRTIEMRE